MEMWKRKSNELTYKWGLFDVDLYVKPRAQFKGTPGINPITGKNEIYYSKYDRQIGTILTCDFN